MRLIRAFKELAIIFRNYYLHILFVLLLTFLLYINALFITHYSVLQMTNSYNNTPYHSGAISFVFDTTNQPIIDISFLSSYFSDSNCILFKHDPSSYGTYEVVFCGRNSFKFKDTSCELDFSSSKKQAFSGSNSRYHLSQTFTIGEHTYAIAGILDKHLSEAINRGVFYSNCDLASTESQGCYIWMSSIPIQTRHSFNDFVEILAKYNIEIKVVDVSFTEFQDYVNYKSALILLCIILIFFYILIIFSTSYLWGMRKHQELITLYLLGHSAPQKKICIEYIFCWLLAISMSFLIEVLTIHYISYSYIPVLAVSLLSIVIASLLIPQTTRLQQEI